MRRSWALPWKVSAGKRRKNAWLSTGRTRWKKKRATRSLNSFLTSAGTLTQNKLTLGEPALFGAKDAQELILTGSLASKSEDRDAIDMAVISGLRDSKTIEAYTQLKFIPFDPVHKRTEAEIKGPNGNSFKVTKGAPQVVLSLCHPERDLAEQVNAKVDEFATQGFRTLGVARSDSEGAWHFLGLLPLFDPPREDSAETIKHAGEHGIAVKMVTGDNLAIAKQIASQLELGTDIHVADEFFKEGDEQRTVSPQQALQVEAAEGFA